MATPTKIAIGWENLCLESGVTFIESSQHASHPVENLAIAHPNEFWRITTISGQPNVLVTFAGVRGYDLVAPLYATASPHRNLLQNGHTLDITDGWTSALATTAVQTGVVDSLTLPEVRISAAEAGAGSVEHFIHQTWTRPVSAAWTVTMTAYVNTASVAGSANARLQLLTDVGNNARIDIDLSDGSVNSTAANGVYTIVTATSTLHSGTWYRVQLTVTMGGEGGIQTRLYVLDSSYANTYTGGGESYRTGGATVELGATPGAAISGATGKASFFALSVSADSDDLISIPASRELEGWFASTGWVHGYTKLASVTWASTLAVYFYDPYNGDSQLDISNVGIYEAWQPTFDLHRDFEETVDKFGRRIWDCTFPALTLAEKEAQAEAMAIHCGVGELDQTAAGGQDYGENRIPVFIALDPANPTQSQTMYGWIISYNCRRISVEGGAIRYTAKYRFREVLP